MPLDRRFVPEEIRSEEQLHELLKAKRFEEIARFLKWSRQNLAKLDTLKFALFTKFKSNLLRHNVKLSDADLLSKSVSEIAEILRSQFLKPQQEEHIPEDAYGTLPKTEEEAIEAVVTADVSVIEDERQEFRKALLGEEYKCVIKRGSTFQFKMNKKGTRIEIVIPSNWDIDIEDSLLLDLYDKRFSSGKFELPIGKSKKKSETPKVEITKVETEEQKSEVKESERKEVSVHSSDVCSSQSDEDVKVGSIESVKESEQQKEEQQPSTETPKSESNEPQVIGEEPTEEGVTEEPELVTQTDESSKQTTEPQSETEQPSTSEQNIEPEQQSEIEQTIEPTLTSDTNVSIDVYEEILNLIREGHNFYEIRSKVQGIIRKRPNLPELQGVNGGLAKKATEVITKAVIWLIRNNKLTIEELEGKFSTKMLKKIQQELQ